jgi:hypothetical protein
MSNKAANTTMAKHNARIGSMFNQHRRTLMRAGTLLLALLLLAASGWAQDFVNSGTLTNYGTLTIKANLVNTSTGVINNATSTARIRFTLDTGQFRNARSNIAYIINEGWFIFEGTKNRFTDSTGNPYGSTALGVACNFRVPGNMLYTASADTQNVQARYYTNLKMDGASVKAIPDSVYVSGTYNVTPGSGNRTYSGTFYYDGTGPQTIFAETATSGSVNRYNNLAIMTGSGLCAAGTSTKTIADSQTISLMGNFFSAAGTTLLLKGQLFAMNATANGPITINDPTPGTTFAELRTTGTATYADSVTVTAGLFNVAGGTATVQSGATLLLANSSDARLQLGANTTLDIAGELQNNLPARTNWTFDATSTIRFTRTAAGQTIPYTVVSNPYGKVYTSGGTKSTQAGGDVVMAGDTLTVQSDNITVASTRVWYMTNASATVTYSGAGVNSEIVGQMQRAISGTGSYIFNNARTQVTFTAGTLPTTMTLAVFPQTNPNNYDSTRDVRRRVTVSWSGDSSWTATFRVGYKTSDIPSTWASSVSQSNLRFYESPATGTPEKVSTGNMYNRSAASGADLGYIELAGIRGTGRATMPNGRDSIASGNDLLLRGGPSVIYAIASGRWSNRNTWDEGVEPSPSDEVVIDGYTVHAGYVRDIDNWTDDEDYPTQLAAKITIGSSPNSALLFGSTNGAKTFSLNVGAGVPGEIINNRAGTATITSGTPDTGNSPIDAGLVVYTTSGNEITLQAKSLRNNGTLFNFGEIEVGP